MHGILGEIGISILAATVLGFVFQLFRQPVILGYLVAGALIGPGIGFKLVSAPANIAVISEIGLILLLFIIGLELNPKKLLSSGRQLFYAGVGQFILCVLMGLGFFLLLGYDLSKGRIDALYLALFCALSSTAIVVKLLYDKFELDTLPGPHDARHPHLSGSLGDSDPGPATPFYESSDLSRRHGLGQERGAFGHRFCAQ